MKAEPLKDASVYKQEVAQFVTQSAQQLQKMSKRFNGVNLKWYSLCLIPNPTHDDKTYATISLDFGDEKPYLARGVTLDLTSYLMLRGSEKHSLQEITDRAIAGKWWCFCHIKW